MKTPRKGNDENVPKRAHRVKSIDPRKHEYIAPVYLDNLHEYMYCGADYSILGRFVLQKYWRWVSEQIPLTVAPNMLTFLGFLVSTSGTALLLFFHLTQDNQFPNWVWLYSCFSLFAYQTLDAIDGKQARRTGTGGPMGELFDHGCDAFFTPLLQISISLAVNFNPMQTFWFTSVICNGLFFTIWEQYSTGTLDLGYINGPTEGLVITCGVFMWSFIKGNVWWSEPLEMPIQIPFTGISLTKANEVAFTAIVFLAICTLGTNVLHVIQKPSVHRKKLRSFLYAVPIPLLFGGYALLTQLFDEMHQRYLFLPEVAFGIVCSFCATRLTISRLCKMPYDVSNKLSVVNLLVVWGLVAATFYGFPRPTVEQISSLCVVCLCFGGVATYYHMIMATFRQLMSHLKINLLTLTPEQLKRNMGK
jgi:ethanolaminephosphotransferase